MTDGAVEQRECGFVLLLLLCPRYCSGEAVKVALIDCLRKSQSNATKFYSSSYHVVKGNLFRFHG